LHTFETGVGNGHSSVGLEWDCCTVIDSYIYRHVDLVC
jgi:hypothetical protein